MQQELMVVTWFDEIKGHGEMSNNKGKSIFISSKLDLRAKDIVRVTIQTAKQDLGTVKKGEVFIIVKDLLTA